MTLEQQLSALLAKHDLLSVTVQAIQCDEDVLITADVQCNVNGVRKSFGVSARGGDASAMLAQSIAVANATRFPPAEVEQLAGIAA